MAQEGPKLVRGSSAAFSAAGWFGQRVLAPSLSLLCESNGAAHAMPKNRGKKVRRLRPSGLR